MTSSVLNPSVNFQTLIDPRTNAEQMCIVIDTKNLTPERYTTLFSELCGRHLECIKAEGRNEYTRHFNIENGIIVYAKKHQENDEEHTLGMHLGVTIKEAFTNIKEAFNYINQEYSISQFALENLQQFISHYDEIGGVEVAKEFVPELEGIEDLLEDPILGNLHSTPKSITNRFCFMIKSIINYICSFFSSTRYFSMGFKN
jgi:hypothetical protein